MTAPYDSPIPIGQRHRTLCDIEMLVLDYDALPLKMAILPAGSIFQPWEPEARWHGEKVPITIGDQATEFDWGLSSSQGHFLFWNDFFSKCVPADSPRMSLPSPKSNAEPARSPFKEILSLGNRLQMQGDYLNPVVTDLFKAANALENVHGWAVEMQLGAEGFDNTESAQRYSEVQARILAAAQELAKACQALAE